MKIEKHWIPLIILIPVLFFIPAFVKSASVDLKITVTLVLVATAIHALWKLFCVVFDFSLKAITISVCRCTKLTKCESCKKKSVRSKLTFLDR
jgi:hypothetical protein